MRISSPPQLTEQSVDSTGVSSELVSPQVLPSKPKLRAVEPQLIEHEGERLILLSDPLGLTDKSLLMPQHVTPLLALCDGSRDVAMLQAGLALRTGIQLSASQIEEVLGGLDAAAAPGERPVSRGVFTGAGSLP